MFQEILLIVFRALSKNKDERKTVLTALYMKSDRVLLL